MAQMGTFKCPSCALPYTTKEQRGTRLPRILKCGHTCCEACIRSRASASHVCECPVCKDQQSFATTSSIQKLLLDSYVLGVGYACSRQQQMPLGPNMELFNLTMKSTIQKEEAAAKGPTVICDECGSSPATCRCDTCPSNFCKPCFDQLHRIAKTMRKHQPRSLSAPSIAMEYALCGVHKRLREFYCTVDGEFICTFCVVVGEHKNHDAIPAAEQNKISILQLQPALDKAMRPYNGIRRTVKKLEAICRSSDNHYNQLAENIQFEFQHLHSLLQLRSNQLLADLKKASEQHMQGVQEQLKQLRSKMEEFKALQKEVSSAVATKTHPHSMLLLERLDSFSNFPCFLLDDLPEHKLEIEVTYGSSLKESLKSHGNLKLTPTENLSLLTVKDLPEGYEEDDLDDTVDNKRVMVSHIRDPANFYVQLCASATKLQRLQNEINNYCMTQDSKLQSEDEIEVGGMYLAQFLMDNNWYRCRVQRRAYSDISVVDGTSFRQSCANVEVFYVDYGNSEVVPMTRLRRMSPRFERLGHLAIKCSLYNVVPRADVRWKKENNALFGKLTLNRKLILREVERQADTLLVDLVDDGEGGCGEVRASITDALVFLEAASYHLPENRVPEKPQAATRRQYYSPTDLCAGQVVNVVVSCILSPQKMFVQELGSSVEGMQTMLGELQHYCNSESTELDILFEPQVGMVCLAKFPHDHLWYRGKIISLVRKTDVEVLFVDYGNQERVPIIWVRRIPDKFMYLPIQAIPVTLADVGPLSNGWTDEVIKRLSQLTLSKHLLMKVHANSEEFQRTKVSLYIPGKDDTDVCVNAVLVKENLAASTGPLSLVEDVPTMKAHLIARPKHSIVQTYDESKVGGRRKKRTAPTMSGQAPPPVDMLPCLWSRKPRQPSHSSTTQRPAMALLAALEMHMAEPSKELAAGERPKKDYVPVHVTYPESPQRFYVRLTEEEKDFKALSSSLHSACNDKKEIKEDWEVGQWCATKGSGQHWMRAKVLDVEQEQLRVFLVDSGRQVVVPRDEGFSLPEALAQPPPFAHVCHLADMIPAGGSKTWSKTAEEAFACLLSRPNRNFMVKLGEELGGSLPVDIMMEEVHEAGALEPMRKEYNSVREALKEMGYGFISKKISKKKSRLNTEPAAESAGAAPSSKLKAASDMEAAPSSEAETAGNGDADAQKEPVVSETVAEDITSTRSKDSEQQLIKVESVPDELSHSWETVSEASSGSSGASDSTPPPTKVEDVSLKASTNVEEKSTKACTSAEKNTTKASTNVEGESTKPASAVEESNEQSDAAASKSSDELAVSSPSSCNTEAVATQLDGAAVEAAHLEKGKDAGDDKSVTDSSPSSCTTDDTQEETDFMVIHDDQPQFQWQRRSFPKEKQLMVMPSHIDEDAVVYVQILNYEDRETYKVMKEKLKEAYCDRPKPLHRTLRIGQACIARYSLDKLFYRAVILNTGEKGIEVRFIDYGTSEYVSPDGIFTDLMFEDVPVLCLEVEFYGLRPFSTTGGWPLKVLDTVHYMMVEQSCSMVVKTRPTKKSRAKVLLFLPDGVSLYEFMLEAGLACKSVEEPLPDSDEADDDLIPCPYQAVKFPEKGVFPVIVTNLDDADLGSIQLAKFANPSNDEQAAINASIDAFNDMAEALQKVADDCPHLLDTSLGTACIGKYGYDKLWYRGIVTGVKKNKVTVYYVDYGNSESIATENLRVLPSKFLEVPMQARACRFHGVRIVGDKSKARLMMSDVLFDEKVGCLARIKNKDSDPIEIDLMNNALELIYQPLADDGCITIDKET
nr:RING finger protein 17-like isoform X2 [Rhipicephalus microplus]